MQPNNQPVIPFTNAHNAIYNSARNTLQQYVAQGVPGMDKVVDALNKQHVEQMQNYQPSQPRPMAATQMPQASVNPRVQTAQLSNLMGQIRQANSPQLPNGYIGY